MKRSPRRVLIADADEATHARYEEALQGIDCDLVVAVDGREALTTALVHPPALLITELRLPFIDGYALCEILRRDRTTLDKPILVATTETRPAEIDRARQAGADAVLAKPIDAATLRVEVERLLAGSQPLLGRSITPRVRASAQRPQSAAPLANGDGQQMLARASQGFETTTPPAAPPLLTCLSCDHFLLYEHSHVGGVNTAEQWDVFVCPTCCRRFEYRHRTRKTRQVS